MGLGKHFGVVVLLVNLGFVHPCNTGLRWDLKREQSGPTHTSSVIYFHSTGKYRLSEVFLPSCSMIASMPMMDVVIVPLSEALHAKLFQGHCAQTVNISSTTLDKILI